MHVRAARPDDEDYQAFARVWDQLDIDAPVPPFAHWADQLCPNTIFLEEDGALAAYSLSFAFGARGDVRQVVVDRPFRGRGVGKRLMAAVADKLRAAGCTEWRLETKADNAPALALYRAIGMEIHHAIEAVRMGRDERARFAATRSGRYQVVEATPADDRDLEASLDLGTGQIARWRRARAGSPLMRVGVAGLTQLWSTFSPERGLLFPFLATEVDVAAHLMAAALDGPEVWEVCVVSPEVHAAVLAVGARQVDQQVELAGKISR